MISLLLLIPIIGSIILLPIKESSNQLKMKQIALTTSLINFFISLFMWYQFDSNITQYQFVTEFNHLNLYHLNFGVDSISLYFVLLTTFVTPIALLSNYTNISNNLKIFLISFLILESLQICAFVSLDLLLFYIFFESAKWFGISLLCLQLSNSGDTLKFMVPNYNRKIISGWSNYSGTVISHKMNENEMGNRGSKSDLITKSVKEQRVDGSYSSIQDKLRYTLMDCESNYQNSFPSNQNFMQTFRLLRRSLAHSHNLLQHSRNSRIVNRSFYTHSKKLFLPSKSEVQISPPFPASPSHPKGALMNPWFITGFTDGEGCFGLYIYSNTASKIGWYVFLDFKFTIHLRDKEILDQIKNYFGVGVISKHGEHLINYSVRSIKDIQLVINHFDKFPLKTKKLNDYNFFKLAADIIKNKEHLTKEGIDKLLAIKSFMNKGLSSDLKLSFPYINNIDPIKIEWNTSAASPDSSNCKKQILQMQPNKIYDPNWVAGFATGEGSFQVDIKKSQTSKQGYQVVLRFSIGQHRRDEQLLIALIEYLDCGRVQKKLNKKYNTEFFEFRVEKFKDIDQKIIPFFVKYSIEGQKLLDFQDFCKVSDLINNKVHVTIEGLNQIRKIKEGMNRRRISHSPVAVALAHVEEPAEQE
jgi:hypothetical protein